MIVVLPSLISSVREFVQLKLRGPKGHVTNSLTEEEAQPNVKIARRLEPSLKLLALDSKTSLFGGWNNV